MSWIRVSTPPGTDLLRDRLSDQERDVLRRLVADRERLLAEARAIEERIQLILLLARDRRGLRGNVRADPETGIIACEEEDHGG